jgi:hypothetical protein
MKRIIASTLMALAIALTATAAFAVDKPCFSNGKALIPAKYVSMSVTGTVYLAAPENDWGKKSLVGYELTKEASGDYSIAEDKVKTGEGHPVAIKTGRPAKADWPNNLAWSSATPNGKHLAFEDTCQ